MTVLYNITLKIPELADELKIIIEDQMPYGSAGFKSRGKKILKGLQKALNLSYLFIISSSNFNIIIISYLSFLNINKKNL